MKKINLSWAVGVAVFAMSMSSWADPLLSLVPITPTTITVPSNATATIQYTVTNNSRAHTLMMVPIAGISQTITGAGICTNPFTLTGGASCTLSLQVNGSDVTTTINSGPKVCQQGVNGQPDLQQCYQPATQAASLNITPSGAALVLGDSFGGGTVACLGGAPYLNLIAASTNNSDSIHWFNGAISTTGATNVFDGLTNTNTIVISQGEVIIDYAAGLCQQYAGGGYHDWFLPAKGQLNCLYNNREAITNFEPFDYWSSTESNRGSAWLQNFNNGNEYDTYTGFTFRVRCVRALLL